MAAALRIIAVSPSATCYRTQLRARRLPIVLRNFQSILLERNWVELTVVAVTSY